MPTEKFADCGGREEGRRHSVGEWLHQVNSTNVTRNRTNVPFMPPLHVSDSKVPNRAYPEIFIARAGNNGLQQLMTKTYSVYKCIHVVERLLSGVDEL